MAQILLLKGHVGINEYKITQHTPISQVKNTKKKRMMKGNTRNAMIMICPLKLAFFMTIATLFCTQINGGEDSGC
jgi:hypothetical protein